MNLETQQSGDVVILRLSGRFDKSTASPVANWLEKIAAKSPAYVVVNLAGIDFVDSTALATLVQGLKRCQRENGELHLCCLQRQVYMIFELTRLDKAFHIFVDEDQAIQAFTN